jgi:protein-tyrosine-phosphatase/predicted ATP-grasp superfamily ATP-dependent carboligase
VPAGKVLVLGDDTRSFLAVVRSLGRRDISVHVAPANFRSPALRSRYIATIHDLPPWIADGVEWSAALTALLQAERFDLVIPCNETALLPMQRHRAILSEYSRLAIPPDHEIAILFDKHATRELAHSAGVPVAAGRLAQASESAEALLAEFGRPIVLKPRRSYSLGTLAARGQVHVVGDPDRLGRLLRECDPNETIIEQFFAGQGVGVSVLASHGRILQAFEHHRVREIAGASFYRVSAPLTPGLARACEAILAALEYTGIAMFEFKLAADGRAILLEVNARPWGSLPLPIALGVDLPYRWYRLLTAGQETAAVGYRVGVYGRNLLPDLEQTLVDVKRRGLGRMATAAFVIGRLAETARLLTGREVHDVLVRDDPRPGLVELLDIAQKLYVHATNRLPGRTARRQRRARATIAAAMRDNAGARQIIFVCQGNICRSPFAAALLRARLGDCAITVRSAGMMPQRGRRTPAFGLAAAATRGIDLAAHRSIWLDRGMGENATLLIAFDQITYRAVLDRYPALRVRLVRLGDVAGIGEITDPIDGGADEFARVYDQIAAAVAALAPLLRGGTATGRCNGH